MTNGQRDHSRALAAVAAYHDYINPAPPTMIRVPLTVAEAQRKYDHWSKGGDSWLANIWRGKLELAKRGEGTTWAINPAWELWARGGCADNAAAPAAADAQLEAICL